MSLDIWVPILPPSVNDLYESRKKGRGSNKVGFRALSDEGKAYKRRFVTEVVPRYQSLLLDAEEMLSDPNVVMEVVIAVFFKSLTTKGWPKTAKNRFRKLDADNRGKITFDCLKLALGGIADDSRFFVQGTEKHQGEEGVMLRIDYSWCDKFGIPLLIDPEGYRE